MTKKKYQSLTAEQRKELQKKNKIYYLKNKEKIDQQVKNWYRENKEYQKKKAQDWRDENKTRVLEKVSEYQKNNKGKVNAKAKKYFLDKMHRTPPWLNNEHFKAIEQIYIQAEELTNKTGIKHHVDHIVPLRGKNVSGLHVPWNLQVLTATENIRKSNKI
jgi:4-hydroxy-L-threonine phosphate dehydrogenase PdxA